MSAYTNALIHETSPYLLQHAQNPVQWYPWGESALSLARQLDKPILLSIGYSACHWCHVMAHESFENPSIAEVMNRLFINIKVDREERPDLDKIYQSAHQVLTQRAGGWPLTMFLTPDTHHPFFGGTYFPATPRYGLPAFTEVLERVAAYYYQQRSEVVQQQQRLTEIFKRIETSPQVPLAQIKTDYLYTARHQIMRNFDELHGGFTEAPKFPHLPTLERLLHHYVLTGKEGHADEEALKAALFTLKKMALGGIYDQLGGGFYRYSVDAQWMIPHFEKMLYDNGVFLSIYSDAWQLTHEPLFKRVIMETADWVLREMRSPEGGFYSSLDADSQGEEGQFYVWKREQIQPMLDIQTFTWFIYHFGLEQPANFEGHWHLHTHHEREEVATHFKMPLAMVETALDKARQILFYLRLQRVYPQRDDKILTAWNALMIKGLAKAGQMLGRPDYLDAATRALDFIKHLLWVDGRLLATYRGGKRAFNAYLDDYAFLLDAILTLLQARWRTEDLMFAMELAEVLLTEFEDKKQGGFYFTAHSHEALLTRTKSFTDEAMPSGNGVAAVALGRLGHLLSEPRYLATVERALQAAWSGVESIAYAYNTLLLAAEDYLRPPQLIILRGDAEILQTWQAACQQQYAPQRLCFAIPTEATDLPAALAGKTAQGEVVAYICTGYECSAPITAFAEFKSALDCVQIEVL